MPLQELLRAIRADAEQERVSADRARTEAATSVVDQARAEAAELEHEICLSLETEAQGEAERLRSAARLQAATVVRAGREEAFATILEQIREELARVRDSDSYAALFGALLAESRAALPAAVELRVDPRDAGLAESGGGGLRVVTTLETCGGLELVSSDGRAIRNTLEERLRNAEGQVRQSFARWLASSVEGGSEGGA